MGLFFSSNGSFNFTTQGEVLKASLNNVWIESFKDFMQYQSLKREQLPADLCRHWQ
jgi:hypothetical protein